MKTKFHSCFVLLSFTIAYCSVLFLEEEWKIQENQFTKSVIFIAVLDRFNTQRTRFVFLPILSVSMWQSPSFWIACPKVDIFLLYVLWTTYLPFYPSIYIPSYPSVHLPFQPTGRTDEEEEEEEALPVPAAPVEDPLPPDGPETAKFKDLRNDFEREWPSIQALLTGTINIEPLQVEIESRQMEEMIKEAHNLVERE